MATSTGAKGFRSRILLRQVRRISSFGASVGSPKRESETARGGEHVGGDAKALGIAGNVVEEQQRAFLLGHQLGQAADFEIPIGAVDLFELADARGAVDESP